MEFAILNGMAREGLTTQATFEEKRLEKGRSAIFRREL